MTLAHREHIALITFRGHQQDVTTLHHLEDFLAVPDLVQTVLTPPHPPGILVHLEDILHLDRIQGVTTLVLPEDILHPDRIRGVTTLVLLPEDILRLDRLQGVTTLVLLPEDIVTPDRTQATLAPLQEDAEYTGLRRGTLRQRQECTVSQGHRHREGDPGNMSKGTVPIPLEEPTRDGLTVHLLPVDQGPLCMWAVQLQDARPTLLCLVRVILVRPHLLTIYIRNLSPYEYGLQLDPQHRPLKILPTVWLEVRVRDPLSIQNMNLRRVVAGSRDLSRTRL